MVLKYKKSTYALLLFASIILFITIAPYLYLFIQSFAAWDEVDRVVIPKKYTLRSYEFLFTGGGSNVPLPWLRALFNSFIVSFSSAFMAIVVALFLGYAVTKIKFKGYKAVNNLILIQMFFPGIILLVPLFMITKNLGMVNQYSGMIVPKMLNAWAIFMYVNYMADIPEEILEAARIDGAGDIAILRRIIIPMVRSITTILFLFIFMERWNELLWDQTVITSNTSLKTLNVLIASVSGPYGSYPGALYAASVILTVPMIILFLVFSKKIVEGISYVAK